MQVLPAIDKVSTDSVPFQDAALDIWHQKYRLKDYQGEAVDADFEASLARVARTLAELEDEDRREHRVFVRREDEHVERNVFRERSREQEVDELLCCRFGFGPVEDSCVFDLAEAPVLDD